MRAVVQRAKKASVTIDNKLYSETEKGLLVFLGIEDSDNEKDIEYIADKIINLRIFEDESDKLNLSSLDVEAQIMIVSQFTLYGDCRKGRRPNFMAAARPDAALPVYNKFVDKIKEYGLVVKTGVFQALMDVSLINDGPVTILLDSKKSF